MIVGLTLISILFLLCAGINIYFIITQFQEENNNNFLHVISIIISITAIVLLTNVIWTIL